MLFEGITLIAGRNLNGKSTSFKALKTVIDNNSNDRQFRHGSTNMAIGMTCTQEIGSVESIILKRGLVVLRLNTTKRNRTIKQVDRH